MKFLVKKHRSDIAFHDGAGARLITWMTGLMVFFITLALTANLALSSITKSWMSGLSDSVTVEISPPPPAAGSDSLTADQKKDFDGRVEKILWLSKQHPSVSSGRRLSEDDIRTLIEPWLGGKIPSDLPLPALVELKLTPEANLQQLQKDIRNLVPGANIDNHQDTLDDIGRLIGTVRAFLLLLTGVITLLAVVAIAGVIRSKLAIHRQEVETLHFLGAEDDYIAGQFRRHALRGTILGALGGIGASLLTLVIIGSVTRTIDSAIMPQVQLMPVQWILLFLLPLLAGAVLAHVTAQVTVMRTLAKMP